MFLQNITGFMVRRKYGHAGIARDVGRIVTAVACFSAPKCAVSIGGSFGAGHDARCGRANAARFVSMWLNASSSVIGGEQAVSVLATVRRDSIDAKGGSWRADEEDAFKGPVREQYELQGSRVTQPCGYKTTASPTRPTPSGCPG